MGPSAPECCSSSPMMGWRMRYLPRGSSTASIVRRSDRARAVPRPPLPPRGLRAGRRRGVAVGTPSVVVAGPDNAATELVRGRRQRLRRCIGRARGSGRGDRRASTKRGTPMRASTATGSNATPSGFRSTDSVETILDPTSATNACRSEPPPSCAGRDGRIRALRAPAGQALAERNESLTLTVFA